VVSRSRFVTTVARAASPGDAHAVVGRIRAELPDATHHCWAFVAGPPGSTTHIGMSDAGEPKGTAGRPMLTVLLHSGVGEVVAVSSRWFGGTKLGTGGLARAYAAGVRHALVSLPTEMKVTRVRFHVRVAYAHVAPLRQLLSELDAVVEEESYAAEVGYRVAVPTGAAQQLAARIADLTAGQGSARELAPDAAQEWSGDAEGVSRDAAEGEQGSRDAAEGEGGSR
jgi:uncharacterized YigZ family protein